MVEHYVCRLFSNGQAAGRSSRSRVLLCMLDTQLAACFHACKALLTWACAVAAFALQALVDWGTQVLDCFKDAAASDEAAATPDANSYEYAVVALNRAFTALGSSFKDYMQEAPAAKKAKAVEGLQHMTGTVLPEQLLNLKKQYNSSASYSADIMLQAEAVLTDMQWFLTMSQRYATAHPEHATVIFQSVINYGEDMMRQLLYWLYYVQFSGGALYAPALQAPTASGTAALGVVQALGASYLPGLGVAPTSPLLLELLGILGTSLHYVTGAAIKASQPLNGSALLGGAMDGLGQAHVVDFWRFRVGNARAEASPAAREAALTDVSSLRSAEDQANAELGLLIAVQQLVQARQIRQGKVSAAAGGNLGVMKTLIGADWAWLEAVGESLNPKLSEDRVQDWLGQSLEIAGLVQRCQGLASGVAAKDKVAACKELEDQTWDVVEELLPKGQYAELAGFMEGALQQQWQCNARGVLGCPQQEGCVLALLPSSAAAYAAASESVGGVLAVRWNVTAAPAWVCQLGDQEVALSKMSNSSKAAIAVGTGACPGFLQLPDCSDVSTGDKCGSYKACSWDSASNRAKVHSAASGVAKGSSSGNGSCEMDWVVLGKMLAREGQLQWDGMEQQCEKQVDASSCQAQVIQVLVGVGSGSSKLSPLIISVAVAVPVFVLVAAAAAVILYRRRQAEEEEDDDRNDANSGAAGRGSRTRRKGAAAGGKKGKTHNKKVKRAEPGKQRPDLMRDSFTDYMRNAPEQFANGVALARAAAAAGPGGANLIDLGDGMIAGARPMPSAGGLIGVLPPPINGLEVGRQLSQQPSLPLSQQEQQYLLGSSYGTSSGSGSGLTVPSSTTGGGESAALAVAFGADANRAGYGANASLARVSHNSMTSAVSGFTGISRYAPSAVGAHGRAGALGTQPSYISSVGDDGEASQVGTPTNSCCHDSVCTFRYSRPTGSGQYGAAAVPPAAVAGRPPVGAAGSVVGVGGGATAPAAAAAGVISPQGSLNRNSWSSQELLVTVSSSAPIDERQEQQ